MTTLPPVALSANSPRRVTMQEIAQALGLVQSSVCRRARRESWLFEKRKGRGGGMVYPIATLPEDVRVAVLAAEAKNVPALVGGQASCPPPDWAHELGMARYRLVREWEAAVARHDGTKAEATAAFLAAYNGGVLLSETHARIGDVSDKTLYRWAKVLSDADGDYLSLCDRRGRWTQGGPKGPGQIGQEAEQIFLGIWLQPSQPSVMLAYNGTKAVLQKRGLPVPSYASVKRFADRFRAHHADLVMLKREGEKALKDKIGPYIARADHILAVGDVLFCDGHRLNFQSIHPLTGKPARMTLICWFDWRSRMPVGWEIMPEEDTIAISSALRMAILNLGQIPRVAYIDNGKAFRGQYFTAESDIEALEGLYARLGISVQFSKPYEARTKVVERFFGTFNEQCARMLDSYTGASIDDKPAWMRRNEPYHAKRHAGYIPTVGETAELFRLFVAWYSRQTHRGLHGATPGEIFAAGRGPGVDAGELSQRFLFRKKVKPQRCGFTIAGIRFESEALYGLNMDIVAAYSWADLSEVQLYDVHGRHIGLAKPQEAIHPLAKHFGTELDLIAVREANKRQQRLRQDTMRLAREFDQDHDESGLSALAWARKQKQPLRVLPKPVAAPEPEPEISSEERAHLETVRKTALAAAQTAPEYTAPARFASPFDRYSVLFEVEVVQGKTLTKNDHDFARKYEQTDEYREVAARRFDALRRAVSASRKTASA